MLAVFTLLSDRDISFCASVREGRFRFPSNLLLTGLGFAFAFCSKSAAKSVYLGGDDGGRVAMGQSGGLKIKRKVKECLRVGLELGLGWLKEAVVSRATV
jgi:hypothetical protein